MSAARANSKPTPIASPLRAATIGIGALFMFWVSTWIRRLRAGDSIGPSGSTCLIRIPSTSKWVMNFPGRPPARTTAGTWRAVHSATSEGSLMRTLVLGGTRFIGRALVAELLSAGQTVAIVHRGEHEVELPPEVEHIHTDRGRLNECREQLSSFSPDAVILGRGATICRLPLVHGEHDHRRREEFVLSRVGAGRDSIPSRCPTTSASPPRSHSP